MYMVKHYLANFALWLSLTVFYCYQYILRIIPSMMLPELTTHYNISATEFGTFAGMYYAGYVAIHIPVGIALARFGGKIIIPICVIVASIGLIPLARYDSWSYVLFGRLLVGVGSSAAIIGGLQIFKIVFPQRFTQTLGMMVCAGLMTVVYINNFIAKIIYDVGIQTTINGLIVSGFGIAIFLLLLIPNVHNNQSDQNIIRDIKTVICNYKLIIVSLLAGMMVGPLEGFADAWGVAFLTSVYDVSRADAASSISLILTGMCLGCVLLPYLADKFRLHYVITFCSAIVMCGCFLYLLSCNADIKTINLLCFLIGISCAYQVVIIAKISTYTDEKLSGIAAAVGNMIIMAFGSIFHKIISTNIQNHSSIIIGNVQTYSKEAYIKGIAIIPIFIAIAIAFFILFFLKQYYQNHQMKKNLIQS
ncbi:MAG: MFS transporter [Rickettsiaceae bacterium]|nr:MAG: MFS transporter [Rickettsiaceae bacterium]